MAIRNIRRQATNPLGAAGTPTSAPIYVDSDDNKLKMIPAGSGTTEVELIDASSVQVLQNKSVILNTYSVDGAVTVVPQTAYLTKTSAGAYSIAAPGAAGVGTQITFTTGTDFAHVVTFTGSTLNDGTTGAKVTWTSAAFKGSSITVVGVTATQWLVVSKNLGTVA